MNNIYAFAALLLSALLISCLLSKNKKADTLQLQQITKEKGPDYFVDKAYLIDEQDIEGPPKFGFRSLRDFGETFVADVTRPEEEFGVLDMDPDQYLVNPVYRTHTPRGTSVKIEVDDDEDGEPELEIDLNQEPAGQFTKTEILVNPHRKHNFGDIIIREGSRGRRSRATKTHPSKQPIVDATAFGQALVNESSRRTQRLEDIGLGIPPKCQLRTHDEDPDCIGLRLADSDSRPPEDPYIHHQTLPEEPPSASSPQDRKRKDASRLSYHNRTRLAADTLNKYQTSPLDGRAHHSQIAGRHIEDTSNAAKRLTAKAYMTPESNSAKFPEIFVPSVPQGAKRAAQALVHTKGPYTYQVFLVSQNLIYTPITVMPYDEWNNPILYEPLVFNYRNSFISSNGVQ